MNHVWISKRKIYINNFGIEVKNNTTLCMTLFALVIFFGMQSCNKDDSSTNNSWSIFDAQEWYAPEPENTEGELVESTMEQPFNIVDEESDFSL